MLTAADFEACLGQTFALDYEGYRDELELLSVDRLPGAQVVGERREAFSLIFLSRHGKLLEQRVYTLVNETVGEQPIFLVPIGQDEAGVSYEAVFS